jgi:hypothetical protein
MSIDAKLSELGITLPEVATPAGSYVPYVVSGNLIYVAGQIPLVNGKLEHKVCFTELFFLLWFLVTNFLCNVVPIRRDE